MQSATIMSISGLGLDTIIAAQHIDIDRQETLLVVLSQGGALWCTIVLMAGLLLHIHR